MSALDLDALQAVAEKPTLGNLPETDALVALIAELRDLRGAEERVKTWKAATEFWQGKAMSLAADEAARLLCPDYPQPALGRQLITERMKTAAAENALGIAYEKFEAAQAEVARLRATVERVRAVKPWRINRNHVIEASQDVLARVYDADEIDAALEAKP